MSISGALDVVISLVVVLILLSLVVQSLQQLAKKVLKLKSRTIETSLADLLGRVVTPIGAGSSGTAGGAGVGAADGTSTVPGAFRRLFSKAQAEDEVVKQVLGQLKSLGRRSLFNNPILDSIAKDDVVKVLTKIGAGTMYPTFQEKFQEVQDALAAVLQAFRQAQQQPLMGSSSAKLAGIEQAFAPLAYDLATLSEGGKVKATAVLGDLLNVRQVKMQNLFDVLGQVQDQVQKDLAAAKAATQPTAGLEAAAAALADAAHRLKDLGDKVEDAVAPLSAKLVEVETWYDTVMQGFNERYTRHMKTVAVVISIVLVIVLNASFFRIYQAVSTDPAVRAELLKWGEQNRKEGSSTQSPAHGTAGQGAASPATPAAPGAATAGAPSVQTALPAAAPPSDAPVGTEAALAPVGTEAAGREAPPPDQGTTPADVRAAAQQVRQSFADYEAFGFARLHRSDVMAFWSVQAPWGPHGTALGWGPWLGEGLTVLLGWIITILLLSAGAPFWEDVLESLFGLKSLVRQKTSSQNVEEGSGGQPKP